MNGSFGDVPSKLIGLPIDRTGLDSGSGHNPTEGTAKMIPAVGFLESPELYCPKGVRPNSPPQITKVSLSISLSFRS